MMKIPSLVTALVAGMLLSAGCSGNKAAIATNETAAIGSLRAIASAEADYARNYDKVFACTLAQLGPPLKNLKPGRDAAGLISERLARDSVTNGYKFSVASCSDTGRSYRLVAVPTELGTTGKRSFCSDQSAHIYYSDDGTADACLAQGKPLP